MARVIAWQTGVCFTYRTRILYFPWKIAIGQMPKLT